MAEFLTTKGIAATIEQIIINAESQLVLISPYLQISPRFIQRLAEASDRGVRTRIVHRQEKSYPEEINALSHIKNISITSVENLHAKCYLNQSTILIASMNFYEYSEQE